MNKLLTTLSALAVACATTCVMAQTPAASSPAAPAPAAAKPVAKPAGAKTVEAKVAMCIGCHGIKGYQASFPEIHKVPMISGQSAKYISAALNAYKAGDRKHPTMRGIAESLSDQDINDISAFYASHVNDGPKPGKEPSKAPNAQIEALLKKAVPCASCHGANFTTPVEGTPKIAGQHADYLFVALKSYKADPKGTVGRTNGVMGGIAKQFTNAELKVLSNYISSLDGELSVHPEPRFR